MRNIEKIAKYELLNNFGALLEVQDASAKT